MQNKLTSELIFSQHKLIPVLVLNDITKAIPIAKALLEGGIKIIEVTLRTPNALNIIETLNHKIPEMLIGAGTVLNEDQYHLAVKHGAKFIVSPGLTHNLIQVSHNYDIPFIPGAITPTEIMSAIDNGLYNLKFFPAENYNGYAVLKSFLNIFPKVKFCPTGGINLDNAAKYLSLGNVAAIGCSFIVTDELVKNNQFNQITDLTKQALNLFSK